MRGRGGAGFPAGAQVGVRARGRRATRSSSSPTATRATPAPTSTRYLMERNPDAAARGHGARRLRGRRARTASCSCAPSTRARSPRSRPRRREARARGPARRRHPRQRLRLRRDDRRGRRLLRRRRGDGAARLPAGAARHGLRAAAVPRRARRATACRPSSTTSRRSATCPFIARARRRGLPRAQPGARRRARKLVCFNERFARPGRLRGAASA